MRTRPALTDEQQRLIGHLQSVLDQQHALSQTRVDAVLRLRESGLSQRHLADELGAHGDGVPRLTAKQVSNIEAAAVRGDQ